MQLQSCRAGKSGAAAIFSVFRKTRIIQMQQNPLFDQLVLQAGHIQRRDIIRHGHCQTAQAGITRVISHIASVTLMILPAAMQLTRSSVYSVRSGIS